MRLDFLGLPTEERRLYLEQAAQRRNVSAVVLEKGVTPLMVKNCTLSLLLRA
jgi:hypothetical protein